MTILTYQIASPEKAVLDFVYVRKLRDLNDERLDLSELDVQKLVDYAPISPEWVGVLVDL